MGTKPVKYVVRRKTSTDEWVVVALGADNQRIEDCCYYTNDKMDAESTRDVLQKLTDEKRERYFDARLNELASNYQSHIAMSIKEFVKEHRQELLDLLRGV